MAFTLVSFHAHPDDEALLTGGTLARTAAQGHRVVLVTATDGAAGLTSAGQIADLGKRRLAELDSAAAALGCQRVVHLGYRDGAFAAVDADVAARKLAALLREESADAMTTYDRAGGYGHPDHKHVHTVGVRAAELAHTPIVLEATIDRRLLMAAVRTVRVIPGAVKVRPADFATSYTARADITHRVDVRAFVPQKLRALAAHQTQTVGGRRSRTVSLLLGLPPFMVARVLGYEWFVERGRQPVKPMLDDIFASVRDRNAR